MFSVVNGMDTNHREYLYHEHRSGQPSQHDSPSIFPGLVGRTCQICGKVVTTKYALQLHTRVHTGERPYKCEVCGKTFNQKGAMKRHERTVHQDIILQNLALHPDIMLHEPVEQGDDHGHD